MYLPTTRFLALAICLTCLSGATLAQEASEPAAVVAPSERADFRYATEWQALTHAGNHVAAANLAETWVIDASVQFGDDAAQTFLPLTRLASAYAAADQTLSAVRTYRKAIKVGERRIGVFSPVLIDPLISLATVLAQLGEDEESTSLLLRAKDITHRNLGIYNTEQNRIVDELSDVYLDRGDVQQAKREQMLLYTAAQRRYGENSPETVPALQKLAEFYTRIERYRDARKYLHRAVELLENAYGPNDLRIAESLQLIAETFYRNRDTTYPREGAKALRRAVATYKNQDVVDHEDLLQAQVSLGDWYLISRQRERALNTYREGIAAAREAGLSDELINARFARPQLITSYSRPSGEDRIGLRRYDGVPLAGIKGKVVFELDVDERGRPKNVRVVEDTIGKRKIVNVLRSRLSMLVFRPRYENGAAVVTRGVRREFSF